MYEIPIALKSNLNTTKIELKRNSEHLYSIERFMFYNIITLPKEEINYLSTGRN